MIYIIDNGQPYSDGTIYFIEVPGPKNTELAANLAIAAHPGGSGSVMGIAETIHWWSGKSMSLEHYMTDYPRDDDTWEDEPEFWGAIQWLRGFMKRGEGDA